MVQPPYNPYQPPNQQQPASYPPPQQYGPYQTQPAGPPPPNYLVSAIIGTVLCCWPAGLVAIIYASQVNSKWAMGDYHGAQMASNNARTWSNISIWSALAIFVLYFLAIIAGAASGA